MTRSVRAGADGSSPAPSLSPAPRAPRCSKCGQPKRGHVCPFKDEDGGAGGSGAGAAGGKKKKAPARQGGQILPGLEPLGASPHAQLANTPPKTPVPGGAPALAPSLTPLARCVPVRAGGGLSYVTRAREAGTSFGALAHLGADLDKETVWTEVFQRLDPSSLAAAGQVCRAWRQWAGDVWADTVGCSLTLAAGAGARGLHPALLLRKCPRLRALELKVGAYIDDRHLTSMALAPSSHLKSFTVTVWGEGENRISNAALTQFLGQCVNLEHLEIHGCGRLDHLEIYSPALKSLVLQGCTRLGDLSLNCPHLATLSLDMLAEPPAVGPASAYAASPAADRAPQQPLRLMRQIAESCSGLSALHVACPALTDVAVDALLSNDFKALAKLAIVHAPGITSAAVDRIVSRCGRLAHLDLSGCARVDDFSLQLIGKALGKTATHLLVAGCPEISIPGVQQVVQALPKLALLDCGYSLVETRRELPQLPPKKRAARAARKGSRKGPKDGPKMLHPQGGSDDEASDEDDGSLCLSSPRLRKISLWGCTRIRSANIACPKLAELVLSDCGNLRGDAVFLSCPNLNKANLEVLGTNASCVLRAGPPRRRR